jgi:hypothetical protein
MPGEPYVERAIVNGAIKLANSPYLKAMVVPHSTPDA